MEINFNRKSSPGPSSSSQKMGIDKLCRLVGGWEMGKGGGCGMRTAKKASILHTLGLLGGEEGRET